MERAINKIITFIEHLRLENLQEQTNCFYCGGAHRTVSCKSDKRAAFHLSIKLLADAIIEDAEENDQEQNLDRIREYTTSNVFNDYSGREDICNSELQDDYNPYSRAMF